MKPGKELDALIAEKIMGLKHTHKFETCTNPVFERCVLCREVQSESEPLLVRCEGRDPRYSTDIAAAWEVVEKIKDKLSFIGPCSDGWNAVLFYDDDCHGFIADTAPHAICLAALQAYAPQSL